MEKFDHMSFLICDAEWLLILSLLVYIDITMHNEAKSGEGVLPHFHISHLKRGWAELLWEKASEKKILYKIKNKIQIFCKSL